MAHSYSIAGSQLSLGPKDTDVTVDNRNAEEDAVSRVVLPPHPCGVIRVANLPHHGRIVVQSVFENQLQIGVFNETYFETEPGTLVEFHGIGEIWLLR